MSQLRSFFFFIFLALPFWGGAQALLPLPRNMVNDSAHIFSHEECARIEQILRNYRDSTSREIMVVTVENFNGYDANSFATELGNQWGIGQRDVNNGLIFLLRPGNMPAVPLSSSVETEWESTRDGYNTEGNPYFLYTFLNVITSDSATAASRATRPEGDYGEGYIATGRGMEGALPDVLAARIMRNVVAPFFSAQRYAEGTEAGLYAVFQSLAGDSTTISEILTTSESEESPSSAYVIFAILLAYSTLVFTGSLISIFFKSIGHALTYLTSAKLRKSDSFLHYWGSKSLESAKRTLRNLPINLLRLPLFLLSSGAGRAGGSSSGGSYSSRGSSSFFGGGGFSGGGGSFGGGGGGSRF